MMDLVERYRILLDSSVLPAMIRFVSQSDSLRAGRQWGVRDSSGGDKNRVDEAPDCTKNENPGSFGTSARWKGEAHPSTHATTGSSAPVARRDRRSSRPAPRQSPR